MSKGKTDRLSNEFVMTEFFINYLMSFFSETQAAIEPLRFQLNQLEKSIAEHHQLIDQLRGNLMMSENKINKIFTDV